MRKRHIILTPGGVVRELRTKKGWTQSILSKLTGIAVPNLSNIEHDRARISEDRAIIIAEALEVKPSFILFPNGYERADLMPRIKEVRKKLKQIKAG